MYFQTWFSWRELDFFFQPMRKLLNCCCSVSHIFYSKIASIFHEIYSFSENLNTLCPQKNARVGFWSISPSNLHQILKVRSVLKSADSENFKTVLDFEFWPTWSWDIGARTHQWSFSFLTWIWKVLTVVTTLLDLQNLNLTSSITYSDIFYTGDAGVIQKLLEILIFIFFVEITQKNDLK